MNIVDVLKILADEGNLNLSISGNVKSRITLFLKNIDVWDALEIVVISGNLAYERRGEIIYIMPEREYELKHGKKYWDTRVLKVFNLKYSKAAKAGAILSQIASKVGKVIIDEPTNNVVVLDIPVKIKQMEDVIASVDKPLETKVFGLNYLPAESLKDKLAGLLSPEVGSLTIDELTNKVVVTDYPEKVLEIAKIIEAFDEKPLQVLIDAKIIEIRPSKRYYSGVNWNYWIKRHFDVRGVFSIPTTSTSGLTYGTIASDAVEAEGDYSGIVEFLEQFGDTRVLSTPRILVLNNQEAKILVGEREAYITSSVSQADGSSVTSQTVNFVDVGVKLYVTPTINRAGYITLKIRPEISSAETVEIVSEDRITEIPIVTTSEVETTVLVRDGVSIIMGGLKRVNIVKQTEQVPILGSIPFLGAFFRNKRDEWAQNELVILLTPHIVSGDKSIERELCEKAEARWQRKALDELERLNKESQPEVSDGEIFLKDQQAAGEEEASAEAEKTSKDSMWEKGAISEFQKQKAQEAMREKETFKEALKQDKKELLEKETLSMFKKEKTDVSRINEAREKARILGKGQMWEKGAIAEYQRQVIQETMMEQEAFAEFDKVQKRLMYERKVIDEFLAADSRTDAESILDRLEREFQTSPSE